MNLPSPNTAFRKSLLILLVLCGVFSSLRAQTITAVVFPGAVAEGGGPGSTGTPFAVFVRIQGWGLAASGQAYLKIYSGTNNEFMWSSTGLWSNLTTYAPANQPTVTLDGTGGWSGWIYAKHNSAILTSVSVRAAKVGATTTNLTTSAINLTPLVMTPGGTGGWIGRGTSPAVNKGIAAYAGGLIVGTYRSEENGIAEGDSLGTGGFRLAVPAGIVDSLVALNDDGTRFSSFVGPWPVLAGMLTDASQEGGTVGKGSAAIMEKSLQGAIPQVLTLRLRGESGAAIGAMRIILPTAFSWARNAGVVSVTAPGAPQTIVAGDTITVTGLSVGAADSALVTILNVTPRDTTASVSVPVATGPSEASLLLLPVAPSVFVYSTPLTIATAREADLNGVPLRTNTLITIRGVVTVANEFGGPSYLQDVSGGMAVFGSAFSTAVALGDEVVVSGTVQPFNGLAEIVNPILHRTVGHGNVVEPLAVDASQVKNDGQGGVEVLEGRLVRLNGVTVTGAGAWAAGTNYPLADLSGTTELRIDNSTNLVGAPIPGGAFDLVGVVGQYAPSSPFIGGYQVMPRSAGDITTTGPIIASVPEEELITPTSLGIRWRTVSVGTTGARYGTTPLFELGVASVAEEVTDHHLPLTGLHPATIYRLQAFSVAGAETSFAPVLVTCTASPAQSTGTVNVYFNQSVDTKVAWDTPALGNQSLAARLLTRINAAHRSIDAALYSLSGSPGTEIAAALVAARGRGVRVRVICEADNQNTSPFTTLATSGIPVVNDAFDPVNAGAGLMHNKFFVFDENGGAPESVWVWTGSWNPTQSGTFDDHQNAVEIQDVSLARAYVAEFQEMWGAAGATPDQLQSRFGARKTDNTPHRFVIGGRRVESYFSPTDRVTSHILAALDSAQHSVAFALLTFTRADLRTALIRQHSLGRKTRGVVDNSTDSGTQYPALLAGGVDVLLKPPAGYYFHHKYAVIDGENPAWHPVTITGSHNWSNAAEGSNNENTLFLHDGTIANFYLQEFAARYAQFGGTDPILVSADDRGGVAPVEFGLSPNYPNPFNPTTNIRLTIVNSQLTIVKVFDVLGREVATLLNEVKAPGSYTVRFDGTGLSSGVYVYRLTAGAYVASRKMLLMR